MSAIKRKMSPECICELCKIQRDVQSGKLNKKQEGAFHRIWDRMESAETLLGLMRYRAEAEGRFSFLGNIWVKEKK